MISKDAKTACDCSNNETSVNQEPDRRSVLKGMAKSAALAPLVVATPAIASAHDTITRGAPTTRNILLAYNHWLYSERRVLAAEMYGYIDADRAIPVNTGADMFHSNNWVILDRQQGREIHPQPWEADETDVMPSDRAEALLRAVGVDMEQVRTSTAVW